jgi:hypothetical protein
MWFRFVEAEYNSSRLVVMVANQAHKRGDWVTDGLRVWCAETELQQDSGIGVVIGQSQPVLDGVYVFNTTYG